MMNIMMSRTRSFLLAMMLMVVAAVIALAAAPAQAAPVLQITQSATPTEVARGDEDVRFAITVRNAVGADPTSGAYTLTSQLPAGLTPVSITSAGTAASAWSCTLATLTCTRSNALNPNAAAPVVTVVATVDDDAPDELTTVTAVSGGGSAAASAGSSISVGPRLPFGVSGFTTSVLDALGGELTRAVAHPVSANAAFAFNTHRSAAGQQVPTEHARRIETHLPPGFVGNPQATTEKCPSLRVLADARCPAGSLVGWADIVAKLTSAVPGPLPPAAIYNMEPPRGMPAAFAFSVIGVPLLLTGELRSDSDFGVTVVAANSPQYPQVLSASVTFCGQEVEVDTSGFFPAYSCGDGSGPGAHPKPFLTNPATECTDLVPITGLRVNSWEQQSIVKDYSAISPLISDCQTLTFEPTVDITPSTTLPDAPSGLNVDMAFPQGDNSLGQAPPALKKAVVTLPEGMGINPSAADGLSACADGELLLRSKDPMSCPDASKIGEVTAVSPLLDQPVKGSVYIRSQSSSDPESGEMFRLALVLQNKQRGIDVRLPGQVRVNEQTGRIETTFDNNPELPVSSLKLRFKDGPRAPLATPPVCGSHTIETVLTSWGKQTKTLASTFNVDCTPGRGSFDPGFQAGMSSPVAGSSSPFSLRVVRPDGDRELKSIQSISMPEGLLGDVGSVELCGEAQAAAGVCPVASRVGHVQAAVGAGPSPLWVPLQGRAPTSVSLTGPYKGAPYGLSIVVPAQAGPFDLGKVVVRSALHVDERTAQITTGIDETRLIGPDGTVTQVLPGDLPRILKGVVLNQREIRVIVDREDFMVNPTDCSQKQITAEIHAYGGGKAAVGNRFRAADCALLGFAPKFGARILDKGRKSTLRSWHPRTRFTVVPRNGDANIGGARVALPSSTILDQANIGTTCTRAQMAARACPEASIVGYAKAWSPLLRKAVEGPVYLAANGGVRPLPDLAAVLDGEIRVVLQGEISTLRTGGKARLQNTFRVVPDAPVSRFILIMQGGKNRGLLVNSTDLCRTKERGVAAFTGQNNRRSRSALRLTPSFKGCGKVRRKAARKAAARKKAAARSAMKR